MRAMRMRAPILAAIAAAGAGALALRAAQSSSVADARLAWVATAHQYGPVSYRDPAGAISPDGQWVAYSEGRFLRVRPIDGGPAVDLPAGAGQIRHVAWRPDG